MEFLLYGLLITTIIVALYVIFFRKKRKKSTPDSSVFNDYSSSSYTANSAYSNHKSKQDPYPYVGHDFDVTDDIIIFDDKISSDASSCSPITRNEDILLPDEDTEVKFGGGMTGGGGAGGDWSSSDDSYSSDSSFDFDITD